MFKNKRVRNWLITVVAVIIIVPVLLQVISPASASAKKSSIEEQVVALEVAETIEASGSL
jgi:hypothetical protein